LPFDRIHVTYETTYEDTIAEVKVAPSRLIYMFSAGLPRTDDVSVVWSYYSNRWISAVQALAVLLSVSGKEYESMSGLGKVWNALETLQHSSSNSLLYDRLYALTGIVDPSATNKQDLFNRAEREREQSYGKGLYTSPSALLREQDILPSNVKPAPSPAPVPAPAPAIAPAVEDQDDAGDQRTASKSLRVSMRNRQAATIKVLDSSGQSSSTNLRNLRVGDTVRFCGAVKKPMYAIERDALAKVVRVNLQEPSVIVEVDVHRDDGLRKGYGSEFVQVDPADICAVFDAADPRL